MSEGSSAGRRLLLLLAVAALLCCQPAGSAASGLTLRYAALGGRDITPTTDGNEARHGTAIGQRALLYSLADSPAVEPPGNGQSYFRIRLTQLSFDQRRLAASELGGVHLLIAHASELSSGQYGGHEPMTGAFHWCCTSALLPRGVDGCTEQRQVGRLIVAAGNGTRGSTSHWYVAPTREHATAVRKTHQLSGVYHGFVVDCFGQELATRARHNNNNNNNDDEMQPTIVSGRLEWMNPYGHLSGDVYPLYVFYGAMAFAHALLALFWLASSCRHWQNLLALQMWISLLVGVGMLESTLWYFDYHTDNQGSSCPPVTAAALLCSAVKRAYARLVFALIASGYGLHQPLLNADARRIVALCAAFCLSSAVEGVADLYVTRYHDDDARWLANASALPSALLDALIFCWLFRAGSSTLRALASRPEHYYKLRVFRAFVYTLTASTLLSSAVLACEFLLPLLLSGPDQLGSAAWLTEASSFLIIFAATVAIVVLFSPASSFFLVKADDAQILTLSSDELVFCTRLDTSPKEHLPRKLR